MRRTKAKLEAVRNPLVDVYHPEHKCVGITTGRVAEGTPTWVEVRILSDHSGGVPQTGATRWWRVNHIVLITGEIGVTPGGKPMKGVEQVT